jgi:hypothetical protein
VEELKVSEDPRTRVYKFHRPAGTINVLWSETGEAPPDLNYRNNPTGELLTFRTISGIDSLKLIHIITDTLNTIPEVKMIPLENDQFTIQLGYEPIFIEGNILPVFTHIQTNPQLSASYKLYQNYPNPFNLSSSIIMTVPKSCKVIIKIYDILGREIRNLVEKNYDPGLHKIEWNGLNNLGKTVQSGIYLIQMKSGNFLETKKCLVLK